MNANLDLPTTLPTSVPVASAEDATVAEAQLAEQKRARLESENRARQAEAKVEELTRKIADLEKQPKVSTGATQTASGSKESQPKPTVQQTSTVPVTQPPNTQPVNALSASAALPTYLPVPKRSADSLGATKQSGAELPIRTTFQPSSIQFIPDSSTMSELSIEPETPSEAILIKKRKSGVEGYANQARVYLDPASPGKVKFEWFATEEQSVANMLRASLLVLANGTSETRVQFCPSDRDGKALPPKEFKISLQRLPEELDLKAGRDYVGQGPSANSTVDNVQGGWNVTPTQNVITFAHPKYENLSFQLTLPLKASEPVISTWLDKRKELAQAAKTAQTADENAKVDLQAKNRDKNTPRDAKLAAKEAKDKSAQELKLATDRLRAIEGVTMDVYVRSVTGIVIAKLSLAK